MYQPHEQRVVDEKEELDEKHHKLRGFIGGEIFNNLNPLDQELLVKQESVMISYSQILQERIARFNTCGGDMPEENSK